MSRANRTLVEDLFAGGHVQVCVLMCADLSATSCQSFVTSQTRIQVFLL